MASGATFLPRRILFLLPLAAFLLFLGRRAHGEATLPAELLARAEAQGSVRVIAELRVVSGDLRATQEAVLQTLAGAPHRVTRRCTTVPFFGLEVSVTVANVADTTPPTATIGSISAGRNNLNVGVTAQDNVGVVKVELYVDGTLSGTIRAAPYNFTVNIRRLPSGPHTVQAKAYDAAGNIGSAQASFTK